MPLINLNGRLFPQDSPVLPASNRSFRYGDGLFESVRFDGCGFPLLHVHWQRLEEGMKALGLRPPGFWNAPFLREEILRILSEGGAARVRLAIFRSGEGSYAPETDEAAFLVEVFPLPACDSAITKSGVIEKVSLAPSSFSAFKTSNSLPYVLASRIRQQNGWEEGVIMNMEGRLADGCHSNIFAVLDGKIATPPVSEGAIAGVMRSVVAGLAEKKETKVEIRPISRKELDQATEIWFSNAISGVRWVKEYEGRPLQNHCWEEFFGNGNGLWENIPNDVRWNNT